MYILDTHLGAFVGNFLKTLCENEAEAAGKEPAAFVFNDREFDSVADPVKLIHNDYSKPLSRESASVIDNLTFVRAPFICDQPHKYYFIQKEIPPPEKKFKYDYEQQDDDEDQAA